MHSRERQAEPNYAPLDAAWDASQRDSRGGNFGGVGPKGYRRRDERIVEDVNDELTRHPGIDATNIEVRCADGEVTLSGSVDSRQCKRAAEDAAASRAGVRDVHNQLRVADSREAVRPPDGIDDVAALGMKDYSDRPVY